MRVSAEIAGRMKDSKRNLDIFICGGSQHVASLKSVLGKLKPYGTVHLASSFLSEADLQELDGLYDVLHRPRHHADGYRNFELFSIRDVDRLATAPYFVKLDADVDLEDDWIDYVEECLAARPDAVLFGPWRGSHAITAHLTGAAARELLGGEIRVENAPKVIGGFYVARTAFFQKHRRVLDAAHEQWCRREGEDTLRNLVVHALGASDRLHIVDSRGRVRMDGHKRLHLF